MKLEFTLEKEKNMAYGYHLIDSGLSSMDAEEKFEQAITNRFPDNDRLDTVKKMLNSGANVNTIISHEDDGVDWEGFHDYPAREKCPLLMQLAWWRSVSLRGNLDYGKPKPEIAKKVLDLIKFCLEHDADPNEEYTFRQAKNYSKSTPLVNAVANDDIELAKLLIRHGADVSFAYTHKYLTSKIGIFSPDYTVSKTYRLSDDIQSDEMKKLFENEIKRRELSLTPQEKREVENDENIALFRGAREAVIERALRKTEKLTGKEKKEAELAILRKTNVQGLRDAEGKARAEKMASILKKKQKGK